MAQVSPIEVQKALKGINYPSSRDAILECAESNGAPQDVIDALRELDDTEYDGPNAVNSALSG